MSDLNEEQVLIFISDDIRREPRWRVATAAQNVCNCVGHSSDIAAHDPLVVIDTEDNRSSICVSESNGRFCKPLAIDI